MGGHDTRQHGPRRDVGGVGPERVGVSLRLVEVGKVFEREVEAVGGVSLDIDAGEFVSILGPSGCGKSTLLRIIAGLERPTTGRVEMDVEGRGVSRETAYVFQDAHLLPWRNVLRNAALPLELRGMAREQRYQRAMEALEQVGLADAARRYPGQLSGGMRMRVSLARALVTRPRLLLMDEPFAALDELTRQRLDDLLLDSWRTRGMTVLFVTHSVMEAAYLSGRAVVLTRRPARLVLDRRLALPEHRTATLRGQAGFAAEMSVLQRALLDGDAA